PRPSLSRRKHRALAGRAQRTPGHGFVSLASGKPARTRFAKMAPVSRPQGLFIVLEGPDKSGKSTQARLLVERLRAQGYPVVHTREPGGTSFAEEVRRILLSTEHQVRPVAELLLYEASRAQHTDERLRPALSAGQVVVCERYTLSTTVYQGA